MFYIVRVRRLSWTCDDGDKREFGEAVFLIGRSALVAYLGLGWGKSELDQSFRSAETVNRLSKIVRSTPIATI